MAVRDREDTSVRVCGWLTAIEVAGDTTSEPRGSSARCADAFGELPPTAGAASGASSVAPRWPQEGAG